MITSFFQPKMQRKKVQPVGDAPNNNKRVGDANSKEEQQQPKKKAKVGTPHSFFTGNSNSSSSSKTSPEASESVKELLSHLNVPDEEASSETTTDADNTEIVHNWNTALQKITSSASFERLAKFVQSQRKSYTVYPPESDTFSALNWTPLQKVKVVIVGQDPYHGPRQAHGLSFSVHKGEKIPPSLRNIYKELVNDKEIANFTRPPTHGYLERWAQQGVLMLNAVLTVRQSEAHSHKKRGWEDFTDEILKAVDRRSKTEGTGVVFLLWGKPATEKVQTALGGLANAERKGHTIIMTSHPSPLGATKTKSPFTGSRCFSRVNKALREQGCDEIDWCVDGPI